MTSRTSAAITGFGCVSPIGLDLAETAKSLLEARPGISPVRLFPTDRYNCKTAGQVDPGLERRALSIDARSRKWERASQMVLVAMDETLRGAPGFSPDVVVVGTTSGGMAFGEKFYRAIAGHESMRHSTRWVQEYLPHRPVLHAMEALNISAPVQIVSTACASGTNALGAALRLIRSGAAERVLAGGYDALAELVFAGFDCLKASTPEICRPFDSGRSGLVLGEGAAFFCLEKSSDEALRLTGYGSATDTHHLTQPHPSGSGPLAAMKAALQSARLAPETIDYINAHGTGTPLNDASEAKALAELFPQTPFSSTKALTGHALGAAGAIEAAYSLIALRDGFLPPNANFRSADEGVNIPLVANTSRRANLRNVLSNSFGFGGANAAVIFSREAA